AVVLAATAIMAALSFFSRNIENSCFDLFSTAKLGEQDGGWARLQHHAASQSKLTTAIYMLIRTSIMNVPGRKNRIATRKTEFVAAFKSHYDLRRPMQTTSFRR
ncbi:MAG: hypothetical protein VB933_06360, partial [Pseudomonadales bacterium]